MALQRSSIRSSLLNAKDLLRICKAVEWPTLEQEERWAKKHGLLNPLSTYYIEAMDYLLRQRWGYDLFDYWIEKQSPAAKDFILRILINLVGVNYDILRELLSWSIQFLLDKGIIIRDPDTGVLKFTTSLWIRWEIPEDETLARFVFNKAFDTGTMVGMTIPIAEEEVTV